MRKLTLCLLCFFAALCLTGFTAFSAIAEDSRHENAGLANAYFPIFPLGAGDEAVPELLPVTSNQVLSGDHAGVTRAVIIIPDYTRDANANAAMITSLAGTANENTFILAPQFLLDTDIARLSPTMGDQVKMLARWPLDGWINGGPSLHAPQQGISSFTALDLIILMLSDTKMFPDLQTVIIVGHGSGGDFVQRYAASGQAPDLLQQQHIAVKFLVANASSYLFFTAPRFLISKPGGKPSLGTPDVGLCPSYNAYPYGLENPNAYVKRAGTGAIKLRYMSRPVLYLVGENASEGDALADQSCAAMLQGPNRVARWMGYRMYLTITFGDEAQKRHTFAAVPKAGFEPAALLGSPCGLSFLFGDGDCH